VYVQFIPEHHQSSLIRYNTNISFKYSSHKRLVGVLGNS